jgi:hypothetical protein
LEFLRFQNQPENITTMTSYLTRLKDNVPMEELAGLCSGTERMEVVDRVAG